MFRTLSRLLSITLVAAAIAYPAVASADDGRLVISFPSSRPYSLPGSNTPTISYPWGRMVITFPYQPPFALPSWDGPLVAAIPGGGLTIETPNNPPFDLSPGVYPAVDLSNTSDLQIEYPAATPPVVTFPGTWRGPVQLPSGSGITVTGYDSGRIVISFPGTYHPPVTLYGWEQRPRIDLPGGGSLVVSLPYGAAPPLDLGPGSGLTVQMPSGRSRTIWVVKRTAWGGWSTMN